MRFYGPKLEDFVFHHLLTTQWEQSPSGEYKQKEMSYYL